MIKIRLTLIAILLQAGFSFAQVPDSVEANIAIIKKNIFADYKGMFREPGGALKYPYITPGSSAYANDLWDWDSWLSDIALRQILNDHAGKNESQQALKYEQGCVLNFLSYTGFDGYMPILVAKNSDPDKIKPANIYKTNMHKPVIAQHAAFLTQLNGGNADWLREKLSYMQAFINNYESHHRDKATGLYYCRMIWPLA